MQTAETFAILAAGGFFLVGLLTGVWKYQQIHTREEAEAHPYVNIAHRTALLYAFACLLLAQFARLSVLSDLVNTIAVAVQVVFFAAAVLSYVVHGWLADTDNQLRKPHQIGKGTLPGGLMLMFMWALIVGEIGGFLVLFYGVILGL
jgi:hypothetical protein